MNEAVSTPARPSQWPAGLLALACIAIQVAGGTEAAATALLAWLATLWVFDRRALRPLWLPRFWLVSLAIALLSGLLLGQPDRYIAGVGVSRAGVRAGLLMVIRGGFMFALSCWASRRLQHQSLQRLAGRMGAGRFAAALAAAFELLPQLHKLWERNQTKLAATAEGGGKLRRLEKAAVALLVQVARLAEGPSPAGAEIPAGRSRLVAVVGSPHTGKTTLLTRLARRLQQAGVPVGGVVQQAVFRNGKRTGYHLHDLQSGEEFALARATAKGNGCGLSFTFAPAGWEWTRRHLEKHARRCRVLVLDEMGLLEARGEGHLPALQYILTECPPEVCLLGVRADCAATIGNYVPGFDLVLEPGEKTEEGVFRILAMLANQDSRGRKRCTG